MTFVFGGSKASSFLLEMIYALSTIHYIQTVSITCILQEGFSHQIKQQINKRSNEAIYSPYLWYINAHRSLRILLVVLKAPFATLWPSCFTWELPYYNKKKTRELQWPGRLRWCPETFTGVQNAVRWKEIRVRKADGLPCATRRGTAALISLRISAGCSFICCFEYTRQLDRWTGKGGLCRGPIWVAHIKNPEFL